MRADNESRASGLRWTRRLGDAGLGLVVLAALVILTVLEYFLARAVSKNLPIMIVMNVADAALIMVFFMHLPRLWGKED